MGNDIVCTIGQEDKKLLLFDDFNCWDEGVLMGKVSPETIEQMRKCNNQQNGALKILGFAESLRANPILAPFVL